MHKRSFTSENLKRITRLQQMLKYSLVLPCLLSKEIVNQKNIQLSAWDETSEEVDLLFWKGRGCGGVA